MQKTFIRFTFAIITSAIFLIFFINSYEYIFARFPTDTEEELFVADRATGSILGHSGGIEQEFHAEYYMPDQLADCTKGAYKRGKSGKIMYVAVRECNDILICFALPLSALLSQILPQVFRTLFFLLLIEAVVILLLNYLVKKKVIKGRTQGAAGAA